MSDGRIHIEVALNSPDMEVVDIEGRPTITIPNGLSIVQAVHLDMGTMPASWSINEHWMSPTPDLHEQILEVPIWPAVEGDIRGSDSIRWLGHEATDQMAADQGLTDFSAWLRTNDWMPTPENGDRMHPYARIRGGLGLVQEIEGTGGEIPDWQSIIDRYGPDDPVVQGFFARVHESVRLDAAMLFTHLAGDIRIRMVFSDAAIQGQVTGQLDEFLLGSGYVPDRSSVAVIEMKKPAMPGEE